MRNEFETLIATTVAVADTSAVAAQSIDTDLWQHVAERGGALGGLLHHDGGGRLRDACWKSSRNMFLLNGESF